MTPDIYSVLTEEELLKTLIDLGLIESAGE